MTSGLLDNWVLVAFLATSAWALSCVIDVCFVSNGIYRRASDGPAIAGLFCVVPILMSTGNVDWSNVTWTVAGVGMLSGVAFLLHIYFYFKALFSLNDAVNAEIFNTLCVLFVPVLAFVLLGERLAWPNYAAIALAVLGIFMLVRLQLSRLSLAVIGYLVASVVAVSLMMVMQAWVLQKTTYSTAVWLFSFSAFITVILVFGLPGHSRRRVGGMCRQFGALFIVVNLLELVAVLGSQRATDLGPSVSLVALIECSLPIFVMVFSVLLARIANRWRPMRSLALHSALSLQTIAAPSKIGSMFLIVTAIFLAQGFSG
ncbi:MAG: hypothetical protein ACR2QR_05265 [Woeseiaceae bacterium]